MSETIIVLCVIVLVIGFTWPEPIYRVRARRLGTEITHPTALENEESRRNLGRLDARKRALRRAKRRSYRCKRWMTT